MRQLFVLLTMTFSVSLFAGELDLAQQMDAKNLSLKGHDLQIEAEKVKQGFLLRSFLPTLTVDFGQERFQTGRYREYGNPYGMIEARINLFRGGRDSIERDIRALEKRIAEHGRDSAFRDQLNKVRKLQWQIVYNTVLIQILEEEKKQNSKIKAQAERRARSGVTSRSDTLEFTIYNSELDEGIETLKHENEILKVGLLPLLGVESTKELSFQTALKHEHDDILLTKPYDAKSHPDVSSMMNQYEAQTLAQRSQKLWWTPKLDLYGGYYMYTLRDRDYISQEARDDRVIGARLTIELFDGMRAQNQASASFYQAEAKRLQGQFTEKETASKYIMLREDLLHTHEVMHYIVDRIAKSKDYLKVTLDEYDRGVKNSLDALTAMQRYFKYEKQYLKKKKEYQVIKADLLSLRGE